MSPPGDAGTFSSFSFSSFFFLSCFILQFAFVCILSLLKPGGNKNRKDSRLKQKRGEKKKRRPTKKLLPASQPSSGFKAWTAEADKGRPPSQQFLQILLLLNFCWTFDRYFFLFPPVPSIRFCSAFGVSVTTPFFFPSFFFLSQSLSIYGSPLSIKRRGVQVARVSESEISVSASSQTNYVKK